MTVEYHHLFSDEMLSRGYSLANRSSIQHLKMSQNQLSAEVLGSKPYEVLVELSEGKINTLACTCPYAGPCKHLAAVFLLMDEEALVKRLDKQS